MGTPLGTMKKAFREPTHTLPTNHEYSIVLLASYSEIASESARAPRLAPGPGEVVGWGAPQRLVIVWDGDSGKIIHTGQCARHHIPPATGAMHALHICAHGGVIYIYTGP